MIFQPASSNVNSPVGLMVSLAETIDTPPQELNLTSRDLDTLRVPGIDSGLPAHLLTRRPDIASIEQRLRAADANIELARCDVS